jgi:hypothetical protein
VHQPMAEKGRLAVSSLLSEKAPLRIKLMTKLMIRGSTTMIATGDAGSTQCQREIEIG